MKNKILSILGASAFLFWGAVASAEMCEKRCSFFIDPLYWKAQQSGSENWAQVFNPVGAGYDIDIEEVGFDWDFGVRVGADYLLKCDGWDTLLSYTWFSTEGKDALHTNGAITSSFVGNFYIDNTDGAKNSGPTYRDAKMRWKILFNVLDWELGKKYFLSRTISLRPFIGVKGASIRQSLHTKWENPITGSFTSATENLHNIFWGIGPSMGLNTEWKLGSNFALFADLSAALMWGRWKMEDKYKNNASSEVAIESSPINSGCTMCRFFVGAEYLCGAWRARLGYEAQFWFEQLRLYSFNMGRLNNELTLQGGTLDLSVNW